MVNVGKINYISPMDPMEKQYTYPALTAMFVEFNHQLHQKIQENIYKSKASRPNRTRRQRHSVRPPVTLWADTDLNHYLP